MIPIEPTIVHAEEHTVVDRNQIISIIIFIGHCERSPNCLALRFIHLYAGKQIKKLIKNFQARELFVEIHIVGSDLQPFISLD
jgi:hypothetical protein